MNWDAASKELQKPLDASTVKSRSQSGRSLSYVEGWHVINEANRIFGFDGWTRETIDLKCVNEKPREIGAAKKPGFGVSYIAKVKVTVSGVVREGVGSGHGIDVDLGLAHESAAKEAETDAMKRALITFGNPFGLALYDKLQANVSHEETIAPKSKATSREDFDRMVKEIRNITSLKALGQWGADNEAATEALPRDWFDDLNVEYTDKKNELKKALAA